MKTSAFPGTFGSPGYGGERDSLRATEKGRGIGHRP